MPDTKVSALTQVGTPTPTTDIPIEVAGSSLRMTFAQMQSTPVILGFPRTLPVNATILTGWAADFIGNIALTGSINLSIAGTGELVMTDDMAQRPNLILAGRA
jgi:hypothetical protein